MRRSLKALIIAAGVLAGLIVAIVLVKDIPGLPNSELALAKFVAAVAAFFGYAIWLQKIYVNWKETVVLVSVALAVVSFTLFFRHTHLRDITEGELVFIKLAVLLFALAGLTTWAIVVKKRV